MDNKDSLINSEETGRFIVTSLKTGRKYIVTSLKTGRKYFVEPIDGNTRTSWRDLDPSTNKLSGDYGTKYKLSVKESKSLITPENGFKNIVTLGPGESPLEYIEKLDKQYEKKENNSGNSKENM